MPRTYEHLNRYEREVIAQMLKEKYSLSQIGRHLGRSPSTIWREFRRNRVRGRYYLRHADGLAQSRLQLARKPQKVMGASKEQMETLLAKYRSPEQIEGRRKLEGDPPISRMTIYRYLYSPRGAGYQKYLRGPGKKKRATRKSHSRIHNQTMIDQRPEEGESRKVAGHWEGDTIQGQTRKEAFKTVTVDNGMEFASHAKLQKKIATPIFFAEGRNPWQRGTNENTNGLLRQFFPKKTDFAAHSSAQLSWAVELLNNRPRKCLEYRTPKETMDSFGFALVS
ncbi:MAG: IS30 family transposase [Kiritimatiellae bacterium]|nr:IS30 family transposase [Kiritimatiellia bacterium]